MAKDPWAAPVKVLWLWACAYCGSGGVVSGEDSGIAMELAREVASDHVLANNDRDHVALFGSASSRIVMEEPKVSAEEL